MQFVITYILLYTIVNRTSQVGTINPERDSAELITFMQRVRVSFIYFEPFSGKITKESLKMET